MTRLKLVCIVATVLLACADDPDGGDAGTTVADTPTPGDTGGVAPVDTSCPEWANWCTPDDPGETGQVDTDGDTDGDTDDTGMTTGPPGPMSDCNNLPALPVAYTILPASTGSEDFTFDTEGNMLGVSFDTYALTRTTYEGVATAILPSVSTWGRGVRVLSNGDYLVAEPDAGEILRITPAGSKTTILSTPDQPNGLAMHPNGMAYLTSGGGQLRRFDPDTGDLTVIDQGPSFDGITFSPDYRTLYYNSETGEVFQMSVDEQGLPTGEPSLMVTIPLTKILDGMTMDECGNLYVVEMTGVVWRVSPELELEPAVEVGDATLMSAVNFGSGYGGWKADHLYIMDLGGAVFEANIGVYSKPVPHLP